MQQGTKKLQILSNQVHALPTNMLESLNAKKHIRQSNDTKQTL